LVLSGFVGRILAAHAQPADSRTGTVGAGVGRNDARSATGL